MRDKQARGYDDKTSAPAPNLNNREGGINEYAVNQHDKEMINNLMSIFNTKIVLVVSKNNCVKFQ